MIVNENCLDGMRCPACQSPGPFWIVASSFFLISDDGVEDHESVEWDAASLCRCHSCDFMATVSVFTI